MFKVTDIPVAMTVASIALKVFSDKRRTITLDFIPQTLIARLGHNDCLVGTHHIPTQG